MSGEAEAAGDALTGAVIARAIEPNAGEARARDEAPSPCRNCGAALNGAYCSNCGQAAHLHRSFLALAHDILHSAFHFEGKFWRTIPELFLRPGRLTRRYIDGERAKFVSPMALFLFTVFLMFAVFSFTTLDSLESASKTASDVASQFKANNASGIARIEDEIEELEEELESPDLTAERRAKIGQEIADLQSARAVMEALSRGDVAALAEIEAEIDARRAAQQASEKANETAAGQTNRGVKVDLGAPKIDARLNSALRQAQSNPELMLYKLKTNSYKFSWALIPLSVPFLWLLFFWRRDIHLYDHAIFVTYSISFMMLLVVVCSLAATLGAPSALWGLAITFIPPIHIYKQLRGAYGVSRFGALMRLGLLMIAILIVLILFLTGLVLIGVLA